MKGHLRGLRAGLAVLLAVALSVVFTTQTFADYYPPGQAAVAPMRAPYSTGYPSSCVRTFYFVRRGDNLFRIGLRFGFSPARLASFNGLRNPNLIFAGMRLAIPCSSRPVPPPPAGQSVVVMQNLAFYPATITIRVGQTVTWRNNDSPPHTTTSGSCSGNVCSPMPGWDSGVLNRGQSFSHTFNMAGTFTYYCRVHGAMMQGSIVVMP